MNDARARIIVQGLVQGVGYRYFALRHGASLGLSGYVRNLKDGTVEIEAEGDRGLVEELIKELRLGPRTARVSAVTTEWKEYRGDLSSFEMRF